MKTDEEINPYSDDVYNDDEKRYISSWPEVAQHLMDRSWSMGVHDALVLAYGLKTETAERLLRLIQNVLVGRMPYLQALPELIRIGTDVTADESRNIAAIIAHSILLPFNNVVQCWDEDICELWSKWKFGS